MARLPDVRSFVGASTGWGAEDGRDRAGIKRSFFGVGMLLRRYLRFGFALPAYGSPSNGALERLPTARGTICFATHIERADGSVQAAGLFCEGPHARAFTLPAACRELVAFKVQIGALRAVLGVPASAARGMTLDLVDVWGPSARQLVERMAEASSQEHRATLLESELLRRCASRPEDDRTTMTLASSVERARGKFTVDKLAQRSGYSRRSLIQRFHDCVGLTPKECLRLTRVRAVIARSTEVWRPRMWTDLAAAFGYCDQAHMIHEFRDLLGNAPCEFTETLDRFRVVGGTASGRRHVPACEQRLYRLLRLVSDWSPANRMRMTVHRDIGHLDPAVLSLVQRAAIGSQGDLVRESTIVDRLRPDTFAQARRTQ